MQQELTGAEARHLRTRNDWSLQYLANLSGVNKAYLSEFENGQRLLPPATLELLQGLLVQQQPAGYAAPKIIRDKNHYRLVFEDSASGKEKSRPPIAHIKWTEDDGTTYTMYVGEP
jgi:transcriptional regulator with XRE-family HTH domain